MTKTIRFFKAIFLLLFITFQNAAIAQCVFGNTPYIQYNTQHNGTYFYAQSFVSTCTGDMEYFELTSHNPGTLNGSLLKVYEGNVASGTPIYSQYYSDIIVDAPFAPITIYITGALPLVSGNQYSVAFILSSSSFNFKYSIDNAYPDGNLWLNGALVSSQDLYFEVSILDQCTPSSIVTDLEELPSINDECSVSVDTPPTATNTCGSVINGVPNLTFPITTPGTTEITWNFDDGLGNTTSQTQNVEIADLTPPVPDLSELPDLTNQCQINTLTPPTASDNCAGTITGTTSTIAPILTLGNSTITWTFDDGNGNIETQTQNVINPTIDNTLTVNGATITANQTLADYQWLDCNDEFAPISEEVNQAYTPPANGNFAVEITLQGCTLTSDCELFIFSGIEEFSRDKKELIRIVDLMGRETEFVPNTPLIYIYSDGTRERILKIEY